MIWRGLAEVRIPNYFDADRRFSLSWLLSHPSSWIGVLSCPLQPHRICRTHHLHFQVCGGVPLLRVQCPARIFFSNLRLFSQSPLQPLDPPQSKSYNSSSVFPYPSTVAISSLLSPFWFPLRKICLPRLEQILKTKTINKEVQTQQVKRLLPYSPVSRFFIPLKAHLTWYPKEGDFFPSS